MLSAYGGNGTASDPKPVALDKKKTGSTIDVNNKDSNTFQDEGQQHRPAVGHPQHPRHRPLGHDIVPVQVYYLCWGGDHEKWKTS